RPARPQLTRNRFPIMRTQHNTTHRNNLRSLRHEDHPTHGALTTGDQGPLQHPWQVRTAGAQKQALPRGNATGVVPPRKTSPPHRAFGTSESDCPGVGLAGLARVGWDGTGRSECPGAEQAGWGGPDGSRSWHRRVRVSRADQVVGADLTGGGLAPLGPCVQGPALWGGAGPDGSRPGAAESVCPVADQVGWGGPDGSRPGAAESVCPVADQVGWGGPDGSRVGTAGSACPEADSMAGGWLSTTGSVVHRP
ncbi:hypothetical protein LV75_006382, partial [Actinokineospora diospyrosa]|nr:hypothetical protein [Actinokineospora diospyrosa]